MPGMFVSSIATLRATGSLVAMLIAVVGVLGLTPDAAAQSRSVALTGASVRTTDGSVLENVTILISEGKISRIGPGIEVPRFTQAVDVSGKFVTPGLIDGASQLGMNLGGSAGSSATRRAVDAFDPFSTFELRDAARHGVTALRILPGQSAGIRGLSALVRFEGGDGGARGSVLVDELDLSINLNSDGRPTARVAIFDDVRKSFRDALAYREGLEAYEVELESYLEKIEERKKKADAEDADKKNGEKKEEIKKPNAPRENREMDVLLRAIDNELPVRIEAHWSADILNAIELAEEFGLRVTIEGASEAHLVAERLADAGVSVILAPLSSGGGETGPRARFDADAYRMLRESGVEVALSAGLDDGRGSRFVLDQAKLAASTDASTDAMRLATAGIAELLGVYEEIGSLRPGRHADVVVWSGDPMDPGSRVERVYVGGGMIYMDPSARERPIQNRRGR